MGELENIVAVDDEESRSLGYEKETPEEETQEPVVATEEKSQETSEVEEPQETTQPKTDIIGDSLSQRVPVKEVPKEEVQLKESIDLRIEVENMRLEREYEKATSGMSAEEIDLIAPVINELVGNQTVDKLLDAGMSVQDVVANTIATAKGRNEKEIENIRNKQAKAKAEAEKKLSEISSFKQKTGDGSSLTDKDQLLKDTLNGDRDATAKFIDSW